MYGTLRCLGAGSSWACTEVDVKILYDLLIGSFITVVGGNEFPDNAVVYMLSPQGQYIGQAGLIRQGREPLGGPTKRYLEHAFHSWQQHLVGRKYNSSAAVNAPCRRTLMERLAFHLPAVGPSVPSA